MTRQREKMDLWDERREIWRKLKQQLSSLSLLEVRKRMKRFSNLDCEKKTFSTAALNYKITDQWPFDRNFPICANYTFQGLSLLISDCGQITNNEIYNVSEQCIARSFK